MIRYDLFCENEHFFESWFKDSKSYQKQLDANEIVCPECDSINISKALMAPGIPKKTNTKKHDQSLPKTSKNKTTRFKTKHAFNWTLWSPNYFEYSSSHVWCLESSLVAFILAFVFVCRSRVHVHARICMFVRICVRV